VVAVAVVVPCSDSAPALEVVAARVTVAARVAVVVVVPPLLAFVALAWLVVAVPPGIAVPFRYGDGSRAVPPTRVSKWRCGPVQLPVQPT
jgi:hypothetical protein